MINVIVMGRRRRRGRKGVVEGGGGGSINPLKHLRYLALLFCLQYSFTATEAVVPFVLI